MKKFISKVALTTALGIVGFLAFSAAPPEAQADPQCPGGQVYGIACHGCFNPGTQVCCASGAIIAGGGQCPIPRNTPVQQHPGQPPAKNPGSGGSVVTPNIPNGCVANLICPTHSTVTITRTPVAPSGWTAGAAVSFHPTKVDENYDRDFDSNSPSGLMACKYGMGPSTVSVTMRRDGNGLSCWSEANVGDGFCCK